MLWLESQQRRHHGSIASHTSSIIVLYRDTWLSIITYFELISIKTYDHYVFKNQPAAPVCSLDFYMWQVIRNTTFHTIRPAVAVAMGTSDWDCMPLIVWVVHFAWTHKQGRELIWWVFMCAVTQQLSCRQDRVGFCCCCCETSLWNLGLLLSPSSYNAGFIPHQRLALFLWRESVRSLRPVSWR